MPLFQKQVQPVLLYGCSVWSLTEVDAYVNIELDRVDRLDWFAVRQVRGIVEEILKELCVDKAYIF